MRGSLKKIGLAAVMALTFAGTALVTAGSAQAQHGHGYGGGPYAYGGDCYIQRRAFINRFGHRVIRRVRVCD